MALQPLPHAVSAVARRWNFNAHGGVGHVRLVWRDPLGPPRPIEVHGIPSRELGAGWVVSQDTLLAVVTDGGFVHTGLGPLATRWHYALVPVGSAPVTDPAVLSVVTRISVTVTGTALARVGTFDGSGTELALAPGGFTRFRAVFPRDVDFRCGVDEVASGWPYLQPGPDDAWAGRCAHSFRLPANDLDLALWLLDRHATRAGSASVIVNGARDESLFFDGRPAVAAHPDVTLPTVGAGPAYLERPLPRELLRRGENVLDIVKDHGSWIAYDALGVFARHGEEPVTGLT